MTQVEENVIVTPVRSRWWGLFFTLCGWLTLLVVILVFIWLPIANTARMERLHRKAAALASDDSSEADSRARWAEIERGAATWLAHHKEDDVKSGTSQGLSFQYAIFPLAFVFFRLGRRLRAVDAFSLLRKDQRPPVLYLRSFKDDSSGGVTPIAPALETEESELIKRLRKIGPVIAIGQPGERLTHAGAARLYVSHAQWRETAARLVADSQLVVLRAGITPGLFWELEHVRQSVAPEKFVLLVAPALVAAGPDANYAAFRVEAEKRLRTPLPDNLHGRRLIIFDSAWQAKAVGAPPGLAGFAHGRGAATFLKHEFDELVTDVEKRSAPSSPASQTLVELLGKLAIEARPTPPIRIRVWVWPLVAAAALVTWFFPSAFAQMMAVPDPLAADPPSLFGSLVEIIFVGAVALGAAFWFYLRDPFRQRHVTLAFAAVFGFILLLGSLRAPGAIAARRAAATGRQDLARAHEMADDVGRFADLVAEWRHSAGNRALSYGPTFPKLETETRAKFEALRHSGGPTGRAAAANFLAALDKFEIESADYYAAKKHLADAGGVTGVESLKRREDVTDRIELLDRVIARFDPFFAANLRFREGLLTAALPDVTSDPKFAPRIKKAQEQTSALGSAMSAALQVDRKILLLLRDDWGAWKSSEAEPLVFSRETTKQEFLALVNQLIALEEKQKQLEPPVR